MSDRAGRHNCRDRPAACGSGYLPALCAAMEIFFDILFPVFGVIVLGYGAARMEWFSESAEKGVATFVFNFAVPVMLFRTIGTTDLPPQPPWGLFASFYGAGILLYGAGMVLARYAFDRDFTGQTITGMGFAFGNSVLIGLPLVLTAYGEEASVPFFILLSVHGITFFTITTILMELGTAREGQDGARDIAAKVVGALIKNPILIGIAAGLAFNLSGFDMPTPVEKLGRLMQGAVAPAALFIAGAAMVRYGLVGRIGQSVVLVAAKLVVFPVLVFVLARFIFDLDPISTQMAVLLAAQPVGVMVLVFAERYGSGQAIATTSIFLSTPVSIATLGIILWLFEVR